MKIISFKICLLVILLVLLTNCDLTHAPSILSAGIPRVVYLPRVYANVKGTDSGTGVIVGWIITNTEQNPALDDPRWAAGNPYIDLPAYGVYTLYVYAKDDSNNISAPLPVEVTYQQRAKNKWTFMIWMDGDNSLENPAIQDFNEIENGLSLAELKDSTLAGKLSVITQLDRIPGNESAGMDGADWTGTRRYLMASDANTGSLDSNSVLLQELGEVNMGNALSLKEFIVFCKEIFPADNYALFFWNHGSGVRSLNSDNQTSRSMCSDDTDSDILYTGEITDVLTDAEDVEVIGIDACYMGMIEVAYEYRPASGKFGANYFVASPNEEQYLGWDYSKILGRLGGTALDGEGDISYDVPTLTGRQLVTIIVKEYRDFIEKSSFQINETMTAVDLTKTAAVKTALDNLAAAAALNPALQTVFEENRGSGAFPAALHYFYANDLAGYVNENGWYATPHFDLYDFAQRVAADPQINSGIQALAAGLMTAVDACVLSSFAGQGYYWQAYNNLNPVDGKHGLGFFFPDGSRIYPAGGSPHHYWCQWWYTDTDTNAWNWGSAYGKIDFCNSDSDDTVETWRELLEYWYDNTAPPFGFTPGTY